MTGRQETPAEFLARMRSVGVISRRSGPTVREGRRADGVRVKATTDELGHTVTEHAKGDRQDVQINLSTSTIHAKLPRGDR